MRSIHLIIYFYYRQGAAVVTPHTALPGERYKAALPAQLSIFTISQTVAGESWVEYAIIGHGMAPLTGHENK